MVGGIKSQQALNPFLAVKLSHMTGDKNIQYFNAGFPTCHK